MKHKTILFCSLFLTAILFSGCTAQSASGVQVSSQPVSQSADDAAGQLSFIPTMDERCAAYEEKYLEPYLLSGLFDLTFSQQDMAAFRNVDAAKENTRFGGTALMFWFEDFVGSEQMADYWAQYNVSGLNAAPEKDGIPAAIVDEVLTAHFELSTEQLHEILSGPDGYYHADRDVYLYYGGRGGIPPVCVVSAAEKNADVLTLQYAYYEDSNTLQNNAVPAQLAQGTLTLRKKEDGGFVYLSNSLTRL